LRALPFKAQLEPGFAAVERVRFFRGREAKVARRVPVRKRR
jgi:hypothetical protein